VLVLITAVVEAFTLYQPFLYKWVLDHITSGHANLATGLRLLAYNVLYLLLHQFLIEQRAIKQHVDGYKAKMMLKTIIIKKLLRMAPGSSITAS
jgi:hypothetical protein